MSGKERPVLPGRENSRVNCFAFYIDRAGNPACRALRDVYCLKETTPCPFRATPARAAAARRKSWRRLVRIGRI